MNGFGPFAQTIFFSNIIKNEYHANNGIIATEDGGCRIGNMVLTTILCEQRGVVTEMDDLTAVEYFVSRVIDGLAGAGINKG